MRMIAQCLCLILNTRTNNEASERLSCPSIPPVAGELLVGMLPWLKPEENTVNVCLLHFYFLKLFNITSHPNLARTLLIGKGLTEGQISYYTPGGGNQQERFSRAM